jgi:hypothetical protein
MKSTQEITQIELGQWIPALRQQVGHVVIGQKYCGSSFAGTAGQRSFLLEGVPGLAKTLTGKQWPQAFRLVSSDCNSRPTYCLQI